MTTLFGIDVRQTIGDAFDGQAQTGTLIRRVGRPVIPDAPDDPKQVDQRYGFQGFVDQRDTKGRTTAKVVVIFGSSISVDPKVDDRLEIGEDLLTVSSVESDFTKAIFSCVVG